MNNENKRKVLKVEFDEHMIDANPFHKAILRCMLDGHSAFSFDEINYELTFSEKRPYPFKMTNHYTVHMLVGPRP